MLRFKPKKTNSKSTPELTGSKPKDKLGMARFAFIKSTILKVLDLSLYGYAIALLIVWAVIWFSGDRWWFGTILLYGPRWIYVLPLLVLGPLVILWRRRQLWLLGFTLLLVVLPIMGFNFPLASWKDSGQPIFRVMTYNLERWEVSDEEFDKLLEEVQPDFAAVQECAPRRWQISSRWYSKRAGTSIIISRYPILRCDISHREPDVNGLYCVLDTPDGPLGFCNVDLLTPRRALSPLLDREKIFNLTQVDYAQMRIRQRWEESEQLFTWLNDFPESHKIFAGDFNLTVDSPIYRKVWSNFQDAFSQTEFGFGYTKKTKINIFRFSARIDHILSTSQLRPLKSWVGPDYGSDHLPLIAEFARN